MSDRTKISWTDATWNPVRGCTKVSAGCKNCYAERFAERWRGIKGHPFEQGFEVRLVPEKLGLPLRWHKPRRVFVNSMSDLFHEAIPFEYIGSVFGVMTSLPRHTFQVLTKRPGRALKFARWLEAKANLISAIFPDDPLEWRILHCMRALGLRHVQCDIGKSWPLPNVWLGVSVEDRRSAEERIPLLLETPAAHRFLSIEPLLEDLGTLDLRGIDWVIVGGESGPGARACDPEWIRSIVRKCSAAHIPVFTKQLGTFWARWAGQKSRKGSDPAEWPKDLRFQEMPR